MVTPLRPDMGNAISDDYTQNNWYGTINDTVGKRPAGSQDRETSIHTV